MITTPPPPKHTPRVMTEGYFFDLVHLDYQSEKFYGMKCCLSEQQIIYKTNNQIYTLKLIILKLISNIYIFYCC